MKFYYFYVVSNVENFNQGLFFLRKNKMGRKTFNLSHHIP